MQPLLFTIALFASFAAAQNSNPVTEQSTTRLLLLNKGDTSLSMFDPIRRRETQRLAVGEQPSALAVSRDGRLAAVHGRREGSHLSTLTLIEIPSATTLGSYRVEPERPTKSGTKDRGAAPALRFLPGGRQLLVADPAAQQLLLFDIERKAVVRTVQTKDVSPQQLAVSDNGQLAFTTNPTCGALAILDLRAGREQPNSVIPTGSGCTDLAVSPTDGLVWLANRTTETLHLFDPEAKRRIASIELPAAPTRLAFTPDGTQALTTCSDTGDVLVIDVRKRTLRRRIEITGDNSEVSCLPVAVCVEPGGQYAWAACTRGEFLAILDLTTGELIDRIPTRPGPGPMAFATPR